MFRFRAFAVLNFAAAFAMVLASPLSAAEIRLRSTSKSMG